MPIIAKGSNFVPAPEGLWPGVCVDVVDKGVVESKQYKPRHMIQLRWIVDAEPPLETGKPHLVSRNFGLTLGLKSSLRPFLEAWRGRKFTDEELRGFDIESLIGANGQVQVIHSTYNGTTYGNVQAVVRAPKNAERMPIPSDYVRECDREHREELEAHPDGNGNDCGPEITDEDIPF